MLWQSNARDNTTRHFILHAGSTFELAPVLTAMRAGALDRTMLEDLGGGA